MAPVDRSNGWGRSTRWHWSIVRMTGVDRRIDLRDPWMVGCPSFEWLGSIVAMTLVDRRIAVVDRWIDVRGDRQTVAHCFFIGTRVSLRRWPTAACVGIGHDPPTSIGSRVMTSVGSSGRSVIERSVPGRLRPSPVASRHPLPDERGEGPPPLRCRHRVALVWTAVVPATALLAEAPASALAAARAAASQSGGDAAAVQTRRNLPYGFGPVFIGRPRLRHASRPPDNADTFVTPLFIRMSAAPALDSSAGHVQYVTIGFPFGKESACPSIDAIGMPRAPAMWPSS